MAKMDKSLHLRLPSDMLEEVEEYAHEFGINVGQAARRMLDEQLKDYHAMKNRNPNNPIELVNGLDDKDKTTIREVGRQPLTQDFVHAVLELMRSDVTNRATMSYLSKGSTIQGWIDREERHVEHLVGTVENYRTKLGKTNSPTFRYYSQLIEAKKKEIEYHQSKINAWKKQKEELDEQIREIEAKAAGIKKTRK